jgi:hypothetical protein
VSGLQGTLGSWAAPTGGSPLRALVSVNGTQPGTNYTLGAFAGGAATIAAEPADAADFDRIAHAPGPVPWLLGAGHLAWPTNGAWRLHELRDGRTPTGGLWIDDDGAAWMGVKRPLAGGGHESAVLVIRNLDP